MKTAHINIGSNLGHRMAYISRAVCLLEERVGHVVAQSSFFESEPQGFLSENLFVNHAVNIITPLDAPQLLSELHAIEKEIDAVGAHRDSSGNYIDRRIDLDLIALDAEIWNVSGLVLPHPRLHLRDFVLRPMAEILPNWVHPIFEKTPLQMLADLNRSQASILDINHIDSNQPLS